MFLWCVDFIVFFLIFIYYCCLVWVCCIYSQVELVPGGSRRAVTSANRLEYVNRVAKHHLVDGVKVGIYFCLRRC